MLIYSFYSTFVEESLNLPTETKQKNNTSEQQISTVCFQMTAFSALVTDL